MTNATAKGAGADIALGLCCLAFSALLYAGALYVPPPIFDPLGSAAVPKICALMIAALALLILVSGVRKRAAAGAAMPAAEGAPRQRFDLGIGLFALCVVYVASLDFAVIGYPWATAAFLLACGLFLGGLTMRNLLISLCIAVVVGFGGDYLFSEFFYIQLPR